MAIKWTGKNTQGNIVQEFVGNSIKDIGKQILDNGFITIDEVLEHTDEDDIENYDNMDDDEKINATLSYCDSLNEQDLKLYIESFNADAYYQKYEEITA